MVGEGLNVSHGGCSSPVHLGSLCQGCVSRAPVKNAALVNNRLPRCQVLRCMQRVAASASSVAQWLQAYSVEDRLSWSMNSSV